MTVPSPARAALSPLPVNTYGSPSGRNLSLKGSLSRKRLIADVDAPEDSPMPQRKCLLFPTMTPPVVSVTRPQEDEAFGNLITTPEWSPITGEPQSPGSAAMDVDARPNSPRASIGSSAQDYDPDDTMESLQTAATEVTQQLQLQPQPRISQQLETLRLRLRLASFKVQTNQTNVPFAQLRLSTASVSPRTIPNDDKNARIPGSIDTTHQSHDNSRQDNPLRSSPPPPSSPSKQKQHDTLDEVSHEKSKPSEHQTPEPPRHRGLLPPQGTTNGDTATLCAFRSEDERLTSSALRGKAAIGLLGLRGELLQ